MDLDEAKAMLADCVRDELRDHAFGDREVFWVKDDVEVAFGYFGHLGHREVGFKSGESFIGDAADALLECGQEGKIERNDSTGPHSFIPGHIEPGLSIEGVREELERRNVFEQAAKNKDVIDITSREVD